MQAFQQSGGIGVMGEQGGYICHIADPDQHNFVRIFFYFLIQKSGSVRLLIGVMRPKL